MKTNTIFEVVKASGRRTAWADKHPAYDLVNGPSGRGVDDLYTPEITNVDGFDATVSVVCTVENDELKVQAILNEIHGRKHDGSPGGGVPAVFGMNFQAVSVGRKWLAITRTQDATRPLAIACGARPVAIWMLQGRRRRFWPTAWNKPTTRWQA